MHSPVSTPVDHRCALGKGLPNDNPETNTKNAAFFSKARSFISAVGAGGRLPCTSPHMGSPPPPAFGGWWLAVPCPHLVALAADAAAAPVKAGPAKSLDALGWPPAATPAQGGAAPVEGGGWKRACVAPVCAVWLLVVLLLRVSVKCWLPPTHG